MCSNYVKQQSAAMLNHEFRKTVFEKFTDELNEELKKSYSIAQERVNLSQEKQDLLNLEHFRLGYVTPKGKVLISERAVIQEYADFNYYFEKQYGKNRKTILTPEILRNCFIWIFSETQFLEFIEYYPDHYGEKVKNQLTIDVPYDKITSTKIRYAVENFLNPLEKQNRGEYIYRPKDEQIFNQTTINELVKDLEEKMKLSIDRTIEDDQELTNIVFIKNKIALFLQEIKSLS